MHIQLCYIGNIYSNTETGVA